MRAFVLQFNLHRLEPNQTARRSLRSSAIIFLSLNAFTPQWNSRHYIIYSGLTIKYVLHVFSETLVICNQSSTVGNEVSAKLISTLRLSSVRLIYYNTDQDAVSYGFVTCNDKI